MLVECAHITKGMKTAELVLRSVPTVLVRTKYVCVYFA